MGTEEEEIKTTGLHNLFNVIIEENFPGLKKQRSSRYRRFTEHQTGKTRKETS
jgi:hypothetical protein